MKFLNPRDFTLTIGSAIFTSEGIGLILPIQSSMKQPQTFDFLLDTVMAIINIIFTVVSFLSYAAPGRRHEDGNHIELATGRQVHQHGAIPLLARGPGWHPRPAIPGRPHNGEQSLGSSLGQARPNHQVEEEYVPLRRGRMRRGLNSLCRRP